MRRALPFLICLIAVPMLAQTRPTLLRMFPIDRIDADLRLRSAELKRDAFIVAQIVAAVGQIDDFQRNVTLSKAQDHIDAAIKRAGEQPLAPQSTFDLLNTEHDLLHHAQQQAAMADLPGLKRDMLQRSHFMQQVLFKELDDVRREKQALSELQTKLAAIATDMDEGLTQALGSTFDYFRAGGQ